MELKQHPEYLAYLQNKETAQGCQKAIATWKKSGELISVRRYGLDWTFEGTQEFVRSLSLMLQEYNRVIWESFPYCRQCSGQCCVVGAAYIGLIDNLALTLLDRPLPALPQRIEITSRDCIYRTSQGCSWPVEWKTLKCWVFFCLGPFGVQQNTSSALIEPYRAITKDLEKVIREHLPDALRKQEHFERKPLISYLGSPLGFAGALGRALDDIFIIPFNNQYPVAVMGETLTHFEEDDGGGTLADKLDFIADIARQVYEIPPSAPKGLVISRDQLLADLELLEWVILGHPENGVKILEEMHSRYAHMLVPKKAGNVPIEYLIKEYINRLKLQLI